MRYFILIAALLIAQVGQTHPPGHVGYCKFMSERVDSHISKLEELQASMKYVFERIPADKNGTKILNEDWHNLQDSYSRQYESLLKDAENYHKYCSPV